MIITQTSPKTNDSAVILCGDKKVVDFARFIFWQIAQHEPERNYDLVFCTPDAGLELNHPKLPDIRVCQINTEFLSGMPIKANIPIANHIKASLPVLFQNDYKKIIYLDTDMFIRRGQISDLFTLAKDGTPISAVLDVMQWRPVIAPVFIAGFQKLGLENTKYFNAGFLVFDVKAYCQENILEGVMKYADDNQQDFQFTDQDALNGYLKGNWAPLPLQWNWQTNPFAARFIERFDPNILHFIGANKPYLHNTPQHTQKYLKEYETFFTQILGKEPVRLKWNTSQPKGTAGQDGKMSKLMGKFNSYYLSAQIKKLLLGDKSGRYLSKIDRAIGSGNKLWPPSALLSGEKDTP